ncbi:MAG: hypothetical protein ACOCZE_11380 [Planctomycetota bacterium]
MPRALPDKPSKDYLRKEAKSLRNRHQRGDPGVCDVLRLLRRFAFEDNDAILHADLSLHEAQFALAMDYGFASWPQLMANVDALADQSPQQRDARRVVIPDVPHANFDIHWDMHIRAAAALLRFRGAEFEMDQLLAVSGEAFALTHASHWQGIGYLSAPIDPVTQAAEAYGFTVQRTHAGPTGPLLARKDRSRRLELAEATLGLIREEIDAGRPVLVTGAEAHCGSSSLVVGYEKDRPWLCHVGDGRPYRWVPLRGVAEGAVQEEFGIMDGRSRGTVTPNFAGGWQANPVFLIGPRTSTPDADSLLHRALDLAVRLHQAPSFHRGNCGGVDYYFGAEAYRQWAAALEALDYPADLDGPFDTNGREDPYDWYNMGNMDMQVDQIVTGRTAAAGFCRTQADRLAGSTASALRRAAEAYQTQVALAREAFAAFIPRFDGNEEPRRRWLSNRRQCRRGAQALGRMLQQEDAAVAAIGQVAGLSESD